MALLLPPEIWIKIFLKLSVDDLISVHQADPKWRDIVNYLVIQGKLKTNAYVGTNQASFYEIWIQFITKAKYFSLLSSSNTTDLTVILR